MKVSGQCLCGIIEFEIEPYQKSVVHCHCSICRRANGAAFVTWVGGASKSLKILTGESQLKAYSSTSECKRSFCGNCGSPLFFESARWPSEVSVALPQLSQSFDQMPRAHIFYSDKLSWVEINDGLPRYGGETGVEPMTADTPKYAPSGPGK